MDSTLGLFNGAFAQRAQPRFKEDVLDLTLAWSRACAGEPSAHRTRAWAAAHAGAVMWAFGIAFPEQAALFAERLCMHESDGARACAGAALLGSIAGAGKPLPFDGLLKSTGQFNGIALSASSSLEAVPATRSRLDDRLAPCAALAFSYVLSRVRPPPGLPVGSRILGLDAMDAHVERWTLSAQLLRSMDWGAIAAALEAVDLMASTPEPGADRPSPPAVRL